MGTGREGGSWHLLMPLENIKDVFSVLGFKFTEETKKLIKNLLYAE